MTLRRYKLLTSSSCEMNYHLNSAKQISVANLDYHWKSLLLPFIKN